MAYIGNAPYQGSVAGTNILDGTIETVDLKDGNVTGAKLETLAGLTSGTYGNSTAIPTITIDVKGRVTAISTTAVSIPSGSISVTGGDLTLSGSTGTAITDATLTSVGTAGTYTKITTDAKGRVTSGTTLASSDLPTYTGTITSSQVTTALGFTPENIANKAVANGYASLDGSGKVPSAQLPSYVDDVLEYANLAAFPVTGSSGIIYVTQDTNKTYRWTGSAYVEISPSPGTTDSLTEGSTNLYYTNARARASLSFTAGSGAYNSTTGAITIPTNTTHLTNGSGYITGNQTVTLSGDASGSGATAITVTLASSGVTAGTYNNVTVDAKGRVTSGSNTSYLTSYTDTLATVTGRGNSTSTNIGSTSGTPLALATAGNVGTWIGGIQDGTSGWSLSQATIGFKSDNNTYAAIGIGTAQGLLYFGRTTASGVGSMASWLEVNSNGVANFVRARPQHNGSNLALVSEIPSLSGYLTSESDTLATVTGRGATTSTAVTLTYSIGDGTAALRLSPTSSSGSFQWASTSLSSGLGSGQTMIHLLGNATGTNNSGYVGYQYGGSAGSTNSFVSLGLYGNDNILRVYGGTYTQSLGSMRAPIFYDSNDTSYYLDPNSTGTSLQIAGTIEQGNNYAHPNIEWSASGTSTGEVIFYLPGTTSNYGMVHMVFDIYEYNSPRLCTVIVGGHNWNTSWYNTACNVVGYTDKQVRLGVKDGRYVVVFGTTGSSWSYGQIRLRKIQNGSYYDNIMDLGGNWSATQTTTESFSTITSDLRGFRTPSTMEADGIIYGYSDIRSPIFYDYNDTSYYINPRSASRLSGLRLDGVDNEASGTDAILWINKPNNNDWAMIVSGNLEYGISLGMAASHSYAIRAQANGTEYSRLGSDVFYHNSNIRAPIFYDYNDTGYYCDPNSLSRLYRTESFYFRNIYGVSTDHPFGLYFDSGESTAYAIYRESGAWNHPYPDLRIAFHTGIKLGANSGYNGIRFYTDYDMSSQVMSVNNGSDGLGANNVYVNNSLQAGSSLRAPIFYDSDNTGYYADLNSTGDSIRAAGNIVAYYSDDRLKTKLGNITDALKKVNQLNGFYYQANELAQNLGYKPTVEVGVSAQEVEQILPQIVKPAPIDQQYKTVDYSRLVPLLIEAVKELSQKLSKLEAKYGITS